MTLIDNVYTIRHILFIVLIAIIEDRFDNALLFVSELMQDGVGLGQV